MASPGASNPAAAAPSPRAALHCRPRAPASRQGLGRRLREIRSGPLVIGFAILLIAALLAGSVALAWQLRLTAIAEAERRVSNLGLLLAEQTAAALDPLDRFLVESGDSFAAPGDRAPAARERARHALLSARASSLPYALSLFVIDRQGAPRQASRSYPPPAINAAEQAYFSIHREQPGRGLFISEPGRDGGSPGKRSFFLSRRLVDPAGAFAGVAVAAVDLAYFEDLYRKLDLEGGGSIVLRRGDGRVLVRYPGGQEASGDPLSDAPAVASPLPRPGVALLTKDRGVRGYPLRVSVSVPLAQALAPWRREVWLIGLGTLCAALVIATVLVLLAQEIAAREGRDRARGESEARFRRLIESSAQGVLIVDQSLNLMFANPALARIFGYESAARMLERQPPVRLVAPEDLGRMRRYGRQRASGRPDAKGFEFRGLRRDGTTIWLESVATSIEWEGRAAFLVTIVDIGERKEAEGALRRSEERVRAILDNIADGIVTIDEQGIVESINPAAEKMFGYGAGEVLGKNVSLLMCGPDRRRHDDYLRAYLSTGQSKILNVGPREVVARRKDGAIFPMELAPSEVFQDGARKFIGAMRDLSQRKAAERALVDSESRTAAARRQTVDAIESLSEGFALWDSADRLVLVNSTLKEMYQSHADLLVVGARFEDVLRGAVERGEFPDAEGREEAWIAARVAVHRELTGPLEQRLRDGRWLMISERRTGEGGTVSVRTDITELKRRQHELQEAKEAAELANRSKSQFLANMSHELRTPLNAIIGFAEFMGTQVYGAIGSPKYLEYAGDIRDSGNHLLEVINDILDLSKIEAGKQQMRESSVNLARAADSCLRLVHDRALESGIQISRRIADDLPSLRADERMIKQIVLNLLSNAVKFTPVGGRVTLEVRRGDEAEAVLAVSDTGIGIAAEDMATALAPFGQIDSAFSRRHEGTGLGLPLSKALAELHGASLRLDSEVGVGTTVTVRFPLARVSL